MNHKLVIENSSILSANDVEKLKGMVDTRLSVAIPRAVSGDRRYINLSGNERILLGCIFTKFANGHVLKAADDTVFITLSTKNIMDIVGCTEKSARKYLGNLASAGFISYELRCGAKLGFVYVIYMSQIGIFVSKQ